MQGAGLARRKRLNKTLFLVFSIFVMIVLVFIDQLTKSLFTKIYQKNGVTTVIKDFFYFTYVENTGAAWSFLSDVSWAQLFFKSLTIVSLIIFGLFFVYAYKKNYKWLQFSLAITIAGTIGNFIDRIRFSAVTDFVKFIFGDYHFPVFNVADICLTIGVIMIIFHLLFLDEAAVFSRKKVEVQSKDETV